MNNIIYNFKSFKYLDKPDLTSILDKKLNYSGSFGFIDKYKDRKFICLEIVWSIKIFYGFHKKKKISFF